MKKTLYFLMLGVIAVMFAGCSLFTSSKSNIEYMPCRTEKNADWGFVDAKGNVVCADMFKYQPSYVREGVFAVEESNDLYALYAFDVKKPKILIEDIKYIGSPRDGVLPICRKDHRIEIVNTKGEVKVTLDKFHQKPIVACWSAFRQGYLPIKAEDGKWGLINKHGELLLDLEYDFVYPITHNYIVVEKNDEYQMVNEHGDKYEQWKSEDIRNIEEDCLYEEEPNDYLVVEKDDRYCIYKTDGELVLKCSDRVREITQVRHKFFVYRGEDGLGVMNFDGERIISDKYLYMLITDNGFLARRDMQHDCELLNKKGEMVRKIDTYKPIIVYFGFGNVGHDGQDIFMLNDKYEATHKNPLYSIGNDNYSSYIHSDFLDVAYLVESLVTAQSDKLYDWGLDFGVKVGENDFLQEQSIDDYNYDYLKISYASAPLYDIDLFIHFDRTSFESVYKNVQVQRWSYYYGYYYDTERRFDHYEKNNEAAIESYEFQITVPSDKQANFMNALCDALEAKYTQSSREATYAKYVGSCIYEVKKSGRNVVFTIKK